MEGINFKPCLRNSGDRLSCIDALGKVHQHTYIFNPYVRLPPMSLQSEGPEWGCVKVRSG